MKIIVEAESLEELKSLLNKLTEKSQEVLVNKGRRVEDLDLPTRIVNALRRGGINYVSQLYDLYNKKPITTIITETDWDNKDEHGYYKTKESEVTYERLDDIPRKVKHIGRRSLEIVMKVLMEATK